MRWQRDVKKRAERTALLIIVFVGLTLITAYFMVSSMTGKPEVDSKTESEYNLLEVTIVGEDEDVFWAANTKSNTLGDEIDKENNMSESNVNIELEGELGNRKITSVNGEVNSGGKSWVVYSSQCKGKCESVDTLIIKGITEVLLSYQ